MRDLLEREVAPHTGPGGSWLLHVPTTKGVSSGAPPPLKALLSGLLNEPQLLERWVFTNLYIPCFLRWEGTPTPTVAKAQLNVRRNGDLMFSSTQEATIQGVETGVKGAGFIFQADFTNPFSLDRGQQLTIELIATNVAGSVGLSLSLRIAEEAVSTGNETNPIKAQEAEAILRYYNEHLSGHRTL